MTIKILQRLSEANGIEFKPRKIKAVKVNTVKTMKKEIEAAFI